MGVLLGNLMSLHLHYTGWPIWSLNRVGSWTILGWVDMDFECSTVCPILQRLMEDRQKGLSKWEGKVVELGNQSQPNPGR